MAGYTGNIEAQTLANTNFRQVLYTGKHEQLVVMSLNPGEDIGDEMHPGTDQFFRIEEGEALFLVNEKDERRVGPGDAVIIPAGTYHNVTNTSNTRSLKLYTVYAPPNHPAGTVQKTKADAEKSVP